MKKRHTLKSSRHTYKKQGSDGSGGVAPVTTAENLGAQLRGGAPVGGQSWVVNIREEDMQLPVPVHSCRYL